MKIKNIRITIEIENGEEKIERQYGYSGGEKSPMQAIAYIENVAEEVNKETLQ